MANEHSGTITVLCKIRTCHSFIQLKKLVQSNNIKIQFKTMHLNRVLSTWRTSYTDARSSAGLRTDKMEELQFIRPQYSRT